MTNKREIVYQLYYDDSCPCLEELRDDLIWGVSEEIRHIIADVLADDFARLEIIEGNGCWYEKPHGYLERIEIPYTWFNSINWYPRCSKCGEILWPEGRLLDFSCPDEVAFLIRRWGDHNFDYGKEYDGKIWNNWTFSFERFDFEKQRLNEIYSRFSRQYKNKRPYSIFCADYIDQKTEKHSCEQGYDAIRNRLIRDIEEILKNTGIEASLLPRDTFKDQYWIDPLFIKRREVFQSYGGWNESSWVFNSRIAERFHQSGLPGLEIQPLRMKNRFFPDCKEQFFEVIARPTEWKGDFINDEQFIIKNFCDVCNHASYSEDPRPGDPNFKAWIQCKDKYKSYRKKHILPKQYVPDSIWFYTPVYDSKITVSCNLFVKPAAMALLHDVDLSFAKITEIEVV